MSLILEGNSNVSFRWIDINDTDQIIDWHGINDFLSSEGIKQSLYGAMYDFNGTMEATVISLGKSGKMITHKCEGIWKKTS